MQTYMKLFLIFMILMGVANVSLARDNVRAIQTKITAVHSTAMYIGVMLNNESVKMYLDPNATILKDEKVVELKDLYHGDEVEITYFKKGGFLGMGGKYVVKEIKVIEK